MEDDAAERMMEDAVEEVEGHEDLLVWQEVTKDDNEGKLWVWAITQCPQICASAEAKKLLRGIGAAKKRMEAGNGSGHAVVKELSQVKDAILGVLRGKRARPQDWVAFRTAELTGSQCR